MKEEIARRWVEELRSGKHTQGQGKMCDEATGAMCCLGVLQKVVLGLPIVSGGVLDEGAMIAAEMADAAGASRPYMASPTIEMDIPAGKFFLPALNDGDHRRKPLTFAEIADIIEAHWPLL